MNWIFDNWLVLLIGILLVVYLGTMIYRFLKSSSEEKVKKVREWLLYAVSLAEKELGGGTGPLKLRKVYDMFLTKFPDAAKVLSFEKFSSLVDESLADMENQILTNENIKKFIKN